MNFRPDSLPFGVAPRLLIACARVLAPAEDGFSLVEFCEEIGAPEGEALAVLERMLASGLLSVDVDRPGTFIPMEGFRRVGAASISKGLARAEAEALLRRVIDRAREIEADERFTAVPTCIVAFGSVLTTASHLGDLDLGVDVRYRPKRSTQDFSDSVRQYRAHRVTPEGKVFSALRLRRPSVISLHSLSEVLHLGTPYRVVYGQLPAA